MLVEVDGQELWAEVEGPAAGPTVLLISGADSPCFRWTPAYTGALVDAGLRVVRYDLRDVGASTVTSPDRPYRLEDLAADAVGLLDRLEVTQAHLVGRSMGGAIAQLMALDHPDRVASLTLLSTTPGLADPRLPEADDRVVAALAERLWSPPPSDRDARVGWLVEGARIFAGTAHPFETDVQTALAEREVDECWRPETGHGVAATASVSRLDRLAEITAPTLVVHGTADGVYPVGHAQALHRGITGSELWLVDGLGHETPDAFGPAFTARLIEFVAAR